MSDNHVQEALQNLTWGRSALYRVVYCHLFRTRLTSGDITLTVSTVTDQKPGDTGLIVEDQAAIVMSWSEMKMLAQHLSVLVAAIEQDIGQIPIPHAFSPTVEGQLPIVRSLGMSRPNASAPAAASDGI
jgi:hypothetical protein